MNQKRPLSWKDIHDGEEARKIRQRRRVAFGFDKKPTDEECHPPSESSEGQPRNLFGLGLSGGGIRSALFNDGFLQAISHCGLLRFVDYISSVSGGGYIAGHLVASGTRKRREGGGSFHDDEDCYKMGKDPVTGELKSGRIEEAGGYLSRQVEFWFYFVSSWVFTVALYLGVVGVGASVVALVWRSLDTPLYRTAFPLLGIEEGGELIYAYLPFLAALFVWGIWGLLRGLLLFLPASMAIFTPAWLKVNHWIGGTVAVFALIGLAVFLGNGWTRVGFGPDLHLNHLAQWLAVAAAVMQVAAFIGRNRLFRSERPNASNFQRVTQYMATYGVVFFVLFSAVHWMARENLSGYLENRDMALASADVADWRLFNVVCQDLALMDGKFTGLSKKSNALIAESQKVWDQVEAKQRGESDWHSYQSRHLTSGIASSLALGSLHTTASPQTYGENPPTQSESGEKTPGWRNYAWWKRMACVGELTLATVCGQLGSGRGEPEKFEDLWQLRSLPKISEQLENQHNVWVDKNRLTEQFNNEALSSLLLTHSLLERLLLVLDSADSKSKQKDSGVQVASGSIDIANRKLLVTLEKPNQEGQDSTALSLGKRFDSEVDELHTWVEKRKPQQQQYNNFPMPRVERLHRDVQWALSLEAEPSGKAQSKSHRERLTRLNQNLLRLIYPRLIYGQDVCATQAVIAHDQSARKRWLLFWSLCTVIGFVGTVNLNQQSPLYRYYRRMLASKFLVGWTGSEKIRECSNRESGLDALSDCDPTPVGLAYPLMLGALLDPVRRKVNRRPFLFTPGRVGVTEGEHEFATEASEFDIPSNSGKIKLVDAVAMSGSALAPFMSANRALQLILAFFNLRLGQWIRNPKVDKNFWIRCRIPFLGALSVLREVCRRGSGWRHGFVADGGFVDYLGVNELLARRCRLILVTDSGSNIGGDQLGTLARMLEEASTRHGVRFVDLDHETPIDYGRLVQDDDRMVPQPYLCMRIRYPEEHPAKDVSGEQRMSEPEPAYLIYVQMAITDNDPIEIRQIRNRFPVFPDEPTVNQFYSDEQVAAYRQLGYYIGKRVCSELVRWTPADISAALARDIDAHAHSHDGHSGAHAPCYDVARCAWSPEISEAMHQDYLSGNRLPLFRTLVRRLLAGYRMACFEETTYQEDDIYAEALWDRGEWCFASFGESARRLRPLISHAGQDNLSSQAADGRTNATRIQEMRRFCDAWLRTYEENADVRTAYRRAAFFDLNCAIVSLYNKDAYVGYEVYRELFRQTTGALPDKIADSDWEVLQEALDSPPPTSESHQAARFSKRFIKALQRDSDQAEAFYTQFKGQSPELVLSNPWPLNIESGFIMAAHLAALAVACQQLRRGTPHAVFQIGGRDKLIDLVVSIVQGERRSRGHEEWLKGASPEIIELQRCVFKEAEVDAAASFAYVMTMLVMKLVNPGLTDPPPADSYGRLHLSIKEDKIEEVPDILVDIFNRRPGMKPEAPSTKRELENA